MKMYPTPITEENEDQAVAYIQKLYKTNSRYCIIRRVILPVGSVLFTALSILMTLGAFYSIGDESDRVVYSTFPFIITFWETVGAWTAMLPSEWYVQIPVQVLMVFLVPVVVSGVLSVFISIVYRGKRIEKPTGTVKERAKQLHQLALNVPYSVRSYDEGHQQTAFWGSIVYIGVLVAFLIYGWIKTSYFTDMSDVFSVLLGLAFCCVVVFFVYRLMFRLFIWINSMYYGEGSVPYIHRSETDKYWVSVDEEEAARRKAKEEEERLREQKERERKKTSETSWGSLYAREKQEHEDYLKRLHEWATSDDDFDFTGYGDGI